MHTLLLGLLLLTPAFADGRSNAKKKLEIYIVELAKTLDLRAQSALKKIPNNYRRWLATKYYLGRPEDIQKIWAWTEKETAEYRTTAEYREAIMEVEKVKAKFAELNPGYYLHVNIEIRSLGKQLSNWNGVRSVQRASEDFLDSALLRMADSTYPFIPDSASLERFKTFLVDTCDPRPVPTVAVPGLSQHGQLRAFDFKVRKGNALVAGARSATIKSDWDDAGWTAKLKAAVEGASNKFAGPLDEPYEPWHYTYTP